MGQKLKTEELTYKQILLLWLPLAAMWLLMGIEMPVVNGVMSRLGNVKENLAAFGVTFSIALIIEAPIIQLLSAGTALANSKQSYQRLLNFMHIQGIILTTIHLLLGLTPLYGLLLRDVLGIPEELIPLSRRAFLWMTPWAVAIGYRRLWQGVLIRYKKTSVVPITMTIRLLGTGLALFGAVLLLDLPGAEVGGLALGIGVMAGAAASYIYVRPILKAMDEKVRGPKLTWERLIRFYTPLALTSFTTFIVRPIMSFGLARSAFPVESLAVWPVIISIMFLFQSMSMAFQDVVITLLNSENVQLILRRFAAALGIALSMFFLILALTPLSSYLYRNLSGLNEELMRFTRIPTLIVTIIPGLSAMISWYRGLLIYKLKTGSVAKATIINSVLLIAIILLGPEFTKLPGAVLAAIAIAVSMAAEAFYLMRRTSALTANMSLL